MVFIPNDFFRHLPSSPESAMRKIILVPLTCLLLTFTLAAPARPQGEPPAGGSWIGDVNEDGAVNIFDLLGLLRILATGEFASERQRLLANVDKSADGVVNIFDLLALLRVISGAVEPEAVYWGPPGLAEVRPAHVIPGDTVELTFQNLQGPVPMRLYLRGEETEFLTVGTARATFVTPDSFPGGDMTVVSGADTLGSLFLNIRNTNVHTIAGCRIFPADNPWNQPVDAFPVHPDSDRFINNMNKSTNLHPDMIAGDIYGMPYDVVGGDQPRVPISFLYAGESDPGPYPIPDNAKIEGGVDAPETADRHIIVLDSTNCRLYELFHVFRDGPGWRTGSGAIFDLNSNAQRPDRWTSADAAGVSILAGVVQYDEVAAGEVNHAIRFTIRVSQRAYVYPATHYASPHTDPYLPPMGLRVRLKADFPSYFFRGQALVIFKALQKYGMILADNGGDWYFTGGLSRNWNNTELNTLKAISGGDFEVVDTERMVISGKGERYNVRPGVEVRFPSPDTTFSAGDSIPIRVHAWDNDDHGVSRVEFFAGSEKLGSLDAPPWEFAWREPPGGDHVISSRATDGGGASNTSWGIRIRVE